MKILSIVLLYALWSRPLIATAKAPPTFQTVKGFNDVPDTIIEIANMPRIRSQDSFGVCYAFAATTIAQKKICDKLKYLDCSNIPYEKQISPFSMATFARKLEDYEDPLNPSTFTSIKLDGGNTKLALKNAADAFYFQRESCYPFDQVANKYGFKTEVVDKVIKELEALYHTNKRKTEGVSVEACEECLAKEVKDVNEKLGANVNAKELEAALKGKTFQEFLYGVIFPNQPQLPLECKSLKANDPKCVDLMKNINPNCVIFEPDIKPTYRRYPGSEEAGDGKKLIEKVKDNLKKQNPVAIEGVCIERYPSTYKCKIYHAFVISGYKTVCKDPVRKSDCYDLVKVHNSMGKDWQDQHNGGWVRADNVIENVKNDRGNFEQATISWLD